MRFDLLIKGGDVVDPGGGYEGPLDVAHRRAAASPPSTATSRPRAPRSVIDAERAARHARARRPAHARLPQGHLLGHRPRSGRVGLGRDDLERRRLGGRADAAGPARVRRRPRARAHHGVPQHLEHRARRREPRVREPRLPRRRPLPPPRRREPRPRLRRQGADGHADRGRQRPRAAAARAPRGRGVRAAADGARRVRPARDRGDPRAHAAGRHPHALLHRPRHEDRRRRRAAARRREARVGLGRRDGHRPRHRLVLLRDRRGADGRRPQARRDLDRPAPALDQRPGLRPADDA